MRFAIGIGLYLWAASAAALSFDPIEGFWLNRDRPGNGLSISRRGELLVVAVYTYDEDGTPVWGLASGPHSGAPTFVAPLHTLSGGSPIEAGPHVEPGIDSERELELTFYGDAYATVRIDDASPEVIVPYRFGVGVQGEIWFPPLGGRRLSIPDMDAAWMLVSHGENSSLTTRFARDFDSFVVLDNPPPAFDPFRGFLPGYAYENGEGTLLQCDVSARSPDFPEVCRLNPQVAFGEGGQHGLYVFQTLSMDWHRWRGYVFALDEAERVVTLEEFEQPQPVEHHLVVHRLGNLSYRSFDGNYENDAHGFQPANGWWIADPGSGLFIEQEARHMVVSIYTYGADGTPIWYLAGGEMSSPRLFEAPLHSFRDGVPLGSLEAHRLPVIGGERAIRITFESSQRAEVSIDGQSFSIEPFVFAYPVVSDGVAVFPDLSGEWVMAALDPAIGQPMRLTFSGRAAADSGIDYRALDDSGEEYSLACATAAIDGYCTLTRLDDPATPLLRFGVADIGDEKLQGELAGPDGGFGEAGHRLWGWRVRWAAEAASPGR